MMYEVGSITLVPHTFLSSRRHFRKAGPSGSRTSRAYVGLNRGREARRRNVLGPDNQPTITNHRFGGPPHTAYTLPHKECC